MFYLGIDLGGTNAAVGVVDECGKIIAKASVPTEADKGTEVIITNIVKACNEALEKAGITSKELKSIGVGTPGTLDIKNGVV